MECPEREPSAMLPAVSAALAEWSRGGHSVPRAFRTWNPPFWLFAESFPRSDCFVVPRIEHDRRIVLHPRVRDVALFLADHAESEVSVRPRRRVAHAE